ncbi:MAG: hypothetical protein WD425_07935, partial [Nitrospirales bacterium]
MTRSAEQAVVTRTAEPRQASSSYQKVLPSHSKSAKTQQHAVVKNSEHTARPIRTESATVTTSSPVASSQPVHRPGPVMTAAVSNSVEVNPHHPVVQHSEHTARIRTESATVTTSSPVASSQ